MHGSTLMRRQTGQSAPFDFLAHEKGRNPMSKGIHALRAHLLIVFCFVVSLTMSAGDNQGIPYGNDGLLTGNSQDMADPAAAPSEAAAQTEQIARDIEEADVVKVEGDRVYV